MRLISKREKNYTKVSSGRPILAQTKLSFAFLDSFPVSNGHALVMPKRHVESIWKMTTEEYMDASNLVRQVKDILQKQFDPQGFNIGVNCGEAGDKRFFTPTSTLSLDTLEMYQVREAAYVTSFPARVATKPWILTLPRSIRLSRWGRKPIHTNSPFGEPWRIVPSTDKRSPKISKDNLAPLFLEYYWPLELKYHIRQSIDPARDPNRPAAHSPVTKGRNNQARRKSQGIPKEPAAYATLRDWVGRRAFDDVIRAFISSMANQLLQ